MCMSGRVEAKGVCAGVYSIVPMCCSLLLRVEHTRAKDEIGDSFSLFTVTENARSQTYNITNS